MNIKNYDTFFMTIAECAANMSYAKKRKVGCVIVKNNNILSIGWNGQPDGFDNECEIIDDNGNLKTKDTVIHAEINALCCCLKNGISINGATAYITLSPCKNCALALIQSGIKRIIYKEQYLNIEKTGIDLLIKSGINIEQI